MNKTIYLDNAATTPVLPEALQAMLPYYIDQFGNPSAVYKLGQSSREAIEHARGVVAASLNTNAENIYFTSGGSEADNWAIIGAAEKMKTKGRHIITSKIEHHAVLHTCEYLQNNGFDVTYIDVHSNGIINIDELEKAIRPDTILISIMYANNEIGTIQPIRGVCNVAKRHGVLFHTDAVQAFMNIPIDVEDLGVDMLSASGHKIGAPKGTGFLFVRDGVDIEPLIHGGAQEGGLRAGTENVPGIVGLGRAIEVCSKDLYWRFEKELSLRDYFISRVLTEISGSYLNGDMLLRLPNNVNFSFESVDGEALLALLDLEGICCSSGSACTSGDLNASHVLESIGVQGNIIHGSIRFTLGRYTTQEDIDYTVDTLKSIIQKLRKLASGEYK